MSLLLHGLRRLVSKTGSGSHRMLNGNVFPALNQPHLRQWTLVRPYSTGVKAATKEEIDKLVQKKPLVVFMKGVPEEPRCGFSNAVVQVLRMHGVTSYDSYDVLQDEAIRQGNSSPLLSIHSLVHTGDNI